MIPPSLGLAAMASLLADTNTASPAISSCIAAVPVDWERLLGRPGESVPFFFQGFMPEKVAAAPETKRGRRRARPVSALALQQVIEDNTACCAQSKSAYCCYLIASPSNLHSSQLQKLLFLAMLATGLTIKA